MQRVGKLLEGIGFRYITPDDPTPDLRVALEVTNGKTGLAQMTRIFTVTPDWRAYIIQKDGYEEHRYISAKKAPMVWLDVIQYGP